MNLQIYPDPNNPTQECKAYVVLQKLISQGQLKSYDPNGVGNCFEVALNIMLDMAEAGFSTAGWSYALADCKPRQGSHAWLEYDGWAIDFSSGRQVFVPVNQFLQAEEAQEVRRYSLADLQRLTSSPEGCRKLGIFDDEKNSDNTTG